MLTSVAHIGFTVENLDRSVAFYRDILGFTYLGEMKMGGAETAELFQQLGCHARVAYLRPQDPGTPPVELIEFEGVEVRRSTPSLFKTSISELCFATDDIEREYERLSAKGVQFLSEPQTFDSTAYGFGKSRAVYFLDPDDNVLELIQSIEA